MRVQMTRDEYRSLVGTHFRKLKGGRPFDHFEVIEWLRKDLIRVRVHSFHGYAGRGSRWTMQVRELEGLETY
jgi:hypothetical protein